MFLTYLQMATKRHALKKLKSTNNNELETFIYGQGFNVADIIKLKKGGKFLKKLWCCVGGSITR